MNVHILGEFDTVFLGGTTEALKKAFALAESGKKLAVISSQTYLAEDICAGGEYLSVEKLEGLGERAQQALLPDGRIHPDGLKRALEMECEQKGIRFFYHLWKVDVREVSEKKLVTLAGKGGLFGVLCEKTEEFRREAEDLSYQVFVREEEDEAWRLLRVENIGRPGKRASENLYACRKAFLEKYQEEKKNKPGLQMANTFAERGYGAGAEKKETTTKRASVRVQCRSEAGELKKYPEIEVPDLWAMEKRDYDLVVVGGGTAGAMAAFHAARNGVKTALIEPNYQLGGTGTAGGIGYYWFGKRFRDVEEIDKAIYSVFDKVGIAGGWLCWSDYDTAHCGIRAQVFLEKCLEAGVDVFFGQIAWGCVTDGKKVTGVVTAGEEGNVVFCGKMLLDATGDGDLAVAAGADSVYGSDKDSYTLWASMGHYEEPDSYGNSFLGMFVLASDPVDYTNFITDVRRLGAKPEGYPNFLDDIRQEGAFLFDHGNYVAMRESRHVRGMYQLTLKDLWMGRQYEDGLYTCYSNYDPKGPCNADAVYVGLLSPHKSIQIPLSALCPVDEKGERIEGLYVLGKAISATHNIFPSIRMQPDLMHQGSVMGELAAVCLRKGIVPEEMDGAEIRAIVLEKTGDALTLPPHDRTAREMLWEITPETRRHWVDYPLRTEVTEQSAVATVMCAGAEEILPVIKERLASETDMEMRRDLIGYALWHGCDDWTEEYCALLWKELEEAGEQLPPRRSDAYNCVGKFMPDHGIMPETVSRMNLLAYSQKVGLVKVFEEVLRRLESERDYFDRAKGIFHYVESFAFVAEHTGMREFAPLLEKILEFPEIQDVLGKRDPDDRLADRLCILAVGLARGLATLGEPSGYRRLIGLLKGERAPMVHSAYKALRELTGADHGVDVARWEEEICSNERCRQVQKVTLKRW